MDFFRHGPLLTLCLLSACVRFGFEPPPAASSPAVDGPTITGDGASLDAITDGGRRDGANADGNGDSQGGDGAGTDMGPSEVGPDDLLSADFDPLQPPSRCDWDLVLTGTEGKTTGGLAQDSAGNLFWGGNFGGTLDLPAKSYSATGLTNEDVFLLSLARDGNPRWEKVIASNAFDRLGGIMVAESGEVYASGSVGANVDFGGGLQLTTGVHDMFLAAYTNAGTLRWAKLAGGPTLSWFYTAVQHPQSGAIVACGNFHESIDFGGGSRTPLRGSRGTALVFYDAATGAYQQDLLYPHDDIFDLAIDTSGRITVAGRFSGTVDVGFGTSATAAGPFDAYVSSRNAADTFHWFYSFGGVDEDASWSVVALPDGSIVVAGHLSASLANLGGGDRAIQGASAGFVAAYGADGLHRWDRIFDGPGAENVRRITLGNAGELLVAGSYEAGADLVGYNPANAGGEDAFVLALDYDGNRLWGRTVGGTDDDGAGTALRHGDGVIVTGYFKASIDLGCGPHQAKDSAGDLFLVRWAP